MKNENALQIAAKFHWTEDILEFACSWYECQIPENKADIIEQANRKIDEFTLAGGWYESVEIMDFSEILLEIYCKTGDLTATYEDIC